MQWHRPVHRRSHISSADVEVLKPTCAACDVALLCRQYAKVAKPTVGFWAGKRYRAPKPSMSKDKQRGAVKQTRPKRDATAASTNRIAWCRAHAARLRDAVARGDLEPWYLDAAAHYEAEADRHEHTSEAA